MTDYKARLDELEVEWLYPDNSAAVKELWSIARALLKERDEALDDVLSACDDIDGLGDRVDELLKENSKQEQYYNTCSECGGDHTVGPICMACM